MKLKLLFLIIPLLLLNLSCEDLFEEDDDGGSVSTSATENSGYDYTYQCPGGYSEPATVPIPSGTSACQKAYEYYARVYGCNDYENFDKANCKLCKECDLQSYCVYCN